MIVHQIFFVLVVFISFFTSFSLGSHEIRESNKISEVIHLIDQETWFLVDLDNTVFQTKQALGHVDWFQHEVEKLIAKGKSREDAFHSLYPLWKKAQTMTEVMPVEADFPRVIVELQNRGIVVMGLTHRQLFIIPQTLRQIDSLGLDFRRTAPSQETIHIEGIRPSCYTQGVLFVDDFNSKGERLISLLDQMRKKPQKIVFIDDKKKNVEDVAKAASNLGIEYIGVYYTAASDGEKIYSPEWADCQLQFFNTIMSNQQAKKLLANEKEIESTRPKYLYKIISWEQWQESLRQGNLPACSALLSEEQVTDSIQQFEKSTDYVIIKLSSNKFISMLEHEIIPLDAVTEVSITHIKEEHKVA